MKSAESVAEAARGEAALHALTNLAQPCLLFLPLVLVAQVVKSAEAYAEAARDEVALLAAVAAGDPSDAKHCVRLLDQFEHAGPHGSHVCEVFGVMGDDLLALIRRAPRVLGSENKVNKVTMPPPP